ncbi:MAG TPA: hypothetical protein DGT23_22005 [Micromonosporaceae bacterium]|nr:hypothetical protein [Micromonosporaceae bacterium]
MIVVRHLFKAYRPVYAWFWGIVAVVLAGIAVSFEVFGHYTLDDERVSVWESVGQQGPRWFLFVMGILFVTINLPVVIANGITRRAYYRGAIIFTVLSAAAFTVLLMAGFGVEYAVYTANGMMAELPKEYPINSMGEAAKFAAKSFLALLAFMLSGWIVGLVFYRLRVWLAIALTPFAALPISGASLPIDSWAAGVATAGLTIAVAVVIGFILVRTCPIRTKKT